MQDTQTLLPVKASGMGAKIKEILNYIGFYAARYLPVTIQKWLSFLTSIMTFWR